MTRSITLDVNGEAHDVIVRNGDTLLTVLRDRLGLTGTKEGCSNGNCGACTVLMGGEPVVACLVLAEEPAALGLAITTVEGLATGSDLHRVQAALIAHGGTQCGFCTPGFVVSAVALLARNPRPSEADIRHGVAGNICRCTGYNKIVEAIASLAAQPERGA